MRSASRAIPPSRGIPRHARPRYALEYTEGIAFSRGLSEPDEPAIAVRDLTGTLQAWIDIGSPDAARLHKAAKAAPRVAVYTHKDPAQLIRNLAGERIHRADALELYAVDRALVAALAGRLERRMAFSLSINERDLYLSIGDATLTGAVSRCGSEPQPLALALAPSPYSYRRAVIGSIRDARTAGMKPAPSATIASATADPASTTVSYP